MSEKKNAESEKKECQRSTKPLIREFPSIYEFCNGDLNKIFLLLRKGVYPYEDMHSWEKFDEITIPPTEAFYSKLNLEDISDTDYQHAQKVWEVFQIKNRGEYLGLYAQSDTLLLADMFKNFRKMWLVIYEFDPVFFVSAPGLAWQAGLKTTKVKLKLLTDYNMLLMVEKGIRGGICQATHKYAKANKKYIKNYDKNNESSYIPHSDANNLYGWAMSQKLPVNGFKWVEKSRLSEFNEVFIKEFDEDSNTGYFLK